MSLSTDLMNFHHYMYEILQSQESMELKINIITVKQYYVQ